MNYFTTFISSFDIGPLFLLAQILGIIFLAVVFSLILRFTCQKFLTHASVKNSFLSKAFFNSLSGPGILVIWIFALSYITHFVYALTKKIETQHTLNIFHQLALIAAITWFFISLVRSAELSLTSKGVNKTTATAISKVLQSFIIVATVLIVIQELGIDISGLLALGGVGGIVLGFAAKDLLSNFFGGFMVYLDRPFQVGDWIRSPHIDLEGNVEHIGWRLTRIRNFESRPVYVPNSLFTQIIIENPSRMRARRIKTTVGLCYDDFEKISSIIDEIKHMLKNHKDISSEMTQSVSFDQFCDSALNISIYAFAKTDDFTEFKEIQQNILLKIGDIIEKHQAQIAFPTRTVHMIKN